MPWSFQKELTPFLIYNSLGDVHSCTVHTTFLYRLCLFFLLLVIFMPILIFTCIGISQGHEQSIRRTYLCQGHTVNIFRCFAHSARHHQLVLQLALQMFLVVFILVHIKWGNNMVKRTSLLLCNPSRTWNFRSPQEQPVLQHDNSFTVSVFCALIVHKMAFVSGLKTKSQW